MQCVCVVAAQEPQCRRAGGPGPRARGPHCTAQWKLSGALSGDQYTSSADYNAYSMSSTGSPTAEDGSSTYPACVAQRGAFRTAAQR